MYFTKTYGIFDRTRHFVAYKKQYSGNIAFRLWERDKSYLGLSANLTSFKTTSIEDNLESNPNH